MPNGTSGNPRHWRVAVWEGELAREPPTRSVISLLIEHVERRLAGADLPYAAGVNKLAKVVVRRGTRKSKRLLYVASRGFSIGAKQGADSLVHAPDRASERRRFCLSPKL